MRTLRQRLQPRYQYVTMKTARAPSPIKSIDAARRPPARGRRTQHSAGRHNGNSFNKKNKPQPRMRHGPATSARCRSRHQKNRYRCRSPRAAGVGARLRPEAKVPAGKPAPRLAAPWPTPRSRAGASAMTSEARANKGCAIEDRRDLELVRRVAAHRQ